MHACKVVVYMCWSTYGMFERFAGGVEWEWLAPVDVLDVTAFWTLSVWRHGLCGCWCVVVVADCAMLVVVCRSVEFVCFLALKAREK